tara:strand:- start:427 stop:2628 length:2202 start_codon:yes stop_codon:yes gene_type:complete
MGEAVPKGFHKMPDGSLMSDKDMGEYKKGGKVKKKKCPKGKRRSKKTGKCQVVKKKLKTIPERKGAFKPSGTTGTLTADSFGQFGSGGMAQEARIARLQNLVDTQSSNLSHSALQKHLVALGYKPVPEIERDQRYMGDVIDSTGARFAGAPGGNDENFVNGDPYSADRNRLRVQRQWENGQPITRGALRQALHEDAWEGENIAYAIRSDDNTHADEAFLSSYGHGQTFFDDIGRVDDLVAQRNRDPYDRENAYFDEEEDQEFGAGRHTNRERRQRPRSESSYGGRVGGSSVSSAGGPRGDSGGRAVDRERQQSGYGLSGGVPRGRTPRGVSQETLVRGPPFGAPQRTYARGRDEQPAPRRPTTQNIGLGPWAYGAESVSQPGEESEEGFSEIGTSVSGAEPARFGEGFRPLLDTGLATGGDIMAAGGRIGLDLASGAGGAVYDRLPSAQTTGEVITGGALDLAGGAGRAMYNRLPEGPNMDQFLNDASGLVQDQGDNLRGGMRQQPGSEVLGRIPPSRPRAPSTVVSSARGTEDYDSDPGSDIGTESATSSARGYRGGGGPQGGSEPDLATDFDRPFGPIAGDSDAGSATGSARGATEAGRYGSISVPATPLVRAERGRTDGAFSTEISTTQLRSGGAGPPSDASLTGGGQDQLRQSAQLENQERHLNPEGGRLLDQSLASNVSRFELDRSVEQPLTQRQIEHQAREREFLLRQGAGMEIDPQYSPPTPSELP